MSTATAQTTPFTLSDSLARGRSDEARKIREVQGNAFLDYQRGRALPPHMTVLSPQARVAVDSRWSDVCEAMFEYLVLNFPDDLLKLVSSEILAPPMMTFATEIAGRIPDSRAVRDILIPLLSHGSALVREGAIYGLRDHVDAVVTAMLRSLAEKDPSPGVRQAASDMLDEP